MSLILCLLAGALAQDTSPTPAPSTDRPWTPADALRVLEAPLDRFASVGDLDGDGWPDLVGAFREGEAVALRAVSPRDGRRIRVLWRGVPQKWKTLPLTGGYSWDAGGDVDGDGVGDLVLGLPGATRERGAGVVLAVSGASGKLLHEIVGEHELDAFGCSVAALGDVDEDGHADYAVGAPQRDAEAWSRKSRKITQEELGRRALQPGSVEIRSGHDGRRIWRVRGELAGHGLGARVVALGDLDGDGVRDLAAQHHADSEQPALLLSGRTGERIATLDARRSVVGDAGDVDTDGASDLFVNPCANDGPRGGGPSRVYSGRTRELLLERAYPDWLTDLGMTARVGDLDGDGHADLALGDANFHLAGPRDPSFDGEIVDLGTLSLAETLELRSRPWNAFTHESGCLWIVSGRTHEILLGVWGKPGSRDGVGLSATAIPDVSGDGRPDLVVCGSPLAWVLSGPAPRKE